MQPYHFYSHHREYIEYPIHSYFLWKMQPEKPAVKLVTHHQ